jgi:protein involved in polysaccharide export with SLBB domain
MVVVLRAYRSLRGQGALLALITGIVGAAMVPVTVGAQPAAKAGSTMPAVEYSLDQSELGAFAIGDRLKVTLFERYAGGDGRSALSSLVEVSEVAGEYTVGQNGAVFLPLLGDVQVLGLTQAQLRAELIERFKTIHGGM